MTNYDLYHHGILGMKWGVRKDQSSGITKAEKNTNKLASKDAKRYADAKMFYGKTAGTRRKLLNAELNKKKKDIPGYQDAFDKAIKDVDYAQSAKKAVRERKAKDVAYRARVTTKQVIGVTGPLTVSAGIFLYNANKPKVDAFVRTALNKAISLVRKH
ncbi:hypothetical protein FACS189490_13960 [Clostridia bacterium]|nr:hypothetical protein FACS189490_13960 [Clostridia bacterium]